MLGTSLDVRPFLERVGQELMRIDPGEVKALADAVHDCYQRGHFVFVIGNGGSGSNASHLCEDLGKGTLRRQDFDDDKKKRLRVLSSTDNTPYILAWGNDEGFERVFVEQLKNLASPGDLLIAISGSGNSPNILRAVEWAHAHRLTTAGATRLRRGPPPRAGRPPAPRAGGAARPGRGPATPCTPRSTTWGSPSRPTSSSSTG